MKKITYLLAFLSFYSCDPNQENKTEEPSSEKDFELVAHLASEPDGLHPMNNISLNMAYVFESIHKRLFRVDLETLNLIPELAAEMPTQIDSNNFLYTLKSEPRWDDGSKLTADDIRFTLLVNMCPLTNNPQKRTVLQDIVDSVKVIDQSTIQYTTNYPFAGANFIWSDMPVVSQKFYDPDNILGSLRFSHFENPETDYPEDVKNWFNNFNSRKYSHNPEYINGIGPYKVTHWEEDQYVTIERKEDWWGKGSTSMYDQANPTTIHYKVIKDEQTTNAALINGEIDVAFALSSVEAHDLSQNQTFVDNYHLNFVDIFGMTFIAINSRPGPTTGNPVLADSSVRLALSLSTPYDAILKSIYNMGSRQVSIVCPQRPYYNHDLPLPNLDPERAAAILDAANWMDSDGDGIRENLINGKKTNLEFELMYAENPSFQNMAELFAESCLKVGIKVNIKAIDPNAIFPTLMSQKYDALVSSLVADGGFEDLSQVLHTRAWEQKGMNFTGFGNARSDQLLDDINKTFDTEKRKDLYKELQAEFNAQNTFIMLYAVQRKIAVSKKFKNPTVYSEKPSILLHALELAASN